MFKFLSRFLGFGQKTELDLLSVRLIDQGRRLERDQEAANRNAWLQESIDQIKACPVIALSGPHGDLAIGFMAGSTRVSAAKVPMPLIHNYIDCTTGIAFGTVFLWTEQRFQALMKLSAEERWSLFNCMSNINAYDVEVRDDTMPSHILSMPQIVEKLTVNRFFEHLSTYHALKKETNEQPIHI
jgi:virulence-associated protein VapD